MSRSMPSYPAGDSGSPPSNSPGDGGRQQVYLHAGDLVIANRPTAIVTILGSCVAVCLWDATARVGGVNHYLLPFHVEREKSPRFGSIAIPRLLEEVVAAGADPNRLQAKVFGGASVIGESQSVSMPSAESRSSWAVTSASPRGPNSAGTTP